MATKLQPQDIWQPILFGELQERAYATVCEIAQTLAGAPAVPLNDGTQSTEQQQLLANISLAGGWPGLALLFAYCGQAYPGDDDNEIAAAFLQKSVHGVAQVRAGVSLYGGITGVAWTLAHLSQLHDGTRDLCAPADELLQQYLSRTPWQADYDLINGLTGLGFYALERLPLPAATRCLELVLDRLDETAERNADGIAWHTPPQLLSDWQRELCPNGYYNLGLAHGIPGVIALLGGACAAGVAQEKARPLLEGAVRWLLRQKSEQHEWSRFSSWAAPGLEPEQSRLAWCYGDLGASAALLCAARCVGNEMWEQEAVALARLAARRPLETAGARDAGLCHGATGIMHIFNRFYQTTGDEVCKSAALFWAEQTLAMRRSGVGVAGYAAYRLDDKLTKVSWKPEIGLLEGAAGIALALLATFTNIEPAWDRMLALSVPPSP